MRNQKHARYNLTAILTSLIILSFFVGGFAQSQQTPTTDQDTKNDSQIIRCFQCTNFVEVEVSNREGKDVPILTKDDFIIYEDGVKQTISYWAEKEGSVTANKPGIYEICYYPSNNLFDGKFRKIRVEVRTKDKGKLRVKFSPIGYYAKKELLK